MVTATFSTTTLPAPSPARGATSSFLARLAAYADGFLTVVQATLFAVIALAGASAQLPAAPLLLLLPFSCYAIGRLAHKVVSGSLRPHELAAGATGIALWALALGIGCPA